jgi:peptidoglycan hydrolase FlgJ
MRPIGVTPIPTLAAGGKVKKSDDPAKVRDAAQQFEALLIGQILRSVRESGGGWLGSGGDPSGDCATEFAEQHFATTLAQQGGLGLADLISKGLVRNP